MADVNVATVVRTAQALGLSGWPALRAEVRSRYLAGLSAAQLLREHDGGEGGSAVASVGRELTNLQDLAELLDDDQVDRVARLITSARVSLVMGSGSFAAPGLQLSHLAQTIGYDVRLQLTGGTSLLNAVSLLREGDCLVCFQLWRTPREVHHAIRVAHAQGVHVVVVSDLLGGPSEEFATELVVVPSEGSGMFPSLVPTVTVVQAIIGAVVRVDPARASEASDRAQCLWDEHRLFSSS